MRGSRLTACLCAVVAGVLACSAPAGAAQLSKIGDFADPTYVTAPPGDPHRLFVVEKGGTIELLHDGVRKQFLDISSLVRSGGEQGLLSMAPAPDYAASGLFYVYYTAPRPGDSNGSVVTVVEMRRSAADPDVADPTYRRVVFTVDHPTNPNHNGGQLQFGPDGLLYAGTGDGGSGNDPPNNAQNLGVRLGKLLRIDPAVHGASPEIYDWGLRNPWRFSFDRVTGDLAIADVGQSAREEVDFAARGSSGVDYGWRCMEGSIPTPGVSPCTPSPPYVGPVFEYDHSGGRCAIMGGYVVRNHDLDSLYGRYVYADNCVSDIRSLVLGTPATGDASTGLALHGVQSFGEDSCGHLYVASGGGEVDLVVDSAFTPCPVGGPTLPGQGGGGGGGGRGDTVPPKLELSRAGRQHLRRGALYLRVRCDESCGVTASSSVAVPGAARVFSLRKVSRALAGGRRVRLKLKLTKRAQRAARRALGHGRRVRATVHVLARDSAGNQSAGKVRIRLVR